MDKTTAAQASSTPTPIRKAVDGVKNVDTIINGHTPAQTTPADMREFADFVARLRGARAGGEEGRQDRRRGDQDVDDPGEIQGLRRAGRRAGNRVGAGDLRRNEVTNNKCE